MKIEKAIELLTHWQHGGEITSFDDVNTAVKLGLEALKRLQIIKGFPYFQLQAKLPGETEECCKFCGAVHPSIQCPSREGEK